MGGETTWVCNVYLPPASSLIKRNIEEDLARGCVDDILSATPPTARVFICGDMNTRVGTCSPCVEGDAIPRLSEDNVVCARA